MVSAKPKSRIESPKNFIGKFFMRYTNVTNNQLQEKYITQHLEILRLSSMLSLPVIIRDKSL